MCKSRVRLMVFMCVAFVFVLSGCGDKGAVIEETVIDGVVLEGQVESLAGDNTINYTCSDVDYSANGAVPMDLITLSTVPSNFGELLSLIVISDKSERTLLVPVERDEEGNGANFQAPVHPELQVGGGDVTMLLIDDLGNECAPVPFTVETLPSSPGAFRELAELIGDMGHKQERIFGVNLSQMSESYMKENPFTVILSVANEMIQGEANPNSLQRIANRDSPLTNDITEDLWQLMDGLVGQSGLLRSLSEYSESLDGMEVLFSDDDVAYSTPKRGDIVTISSAGSSSFLCNTPLHRPNAQTLHELMDSQIKNEIFNDGTDVMDAANLLWGVAGMLATAAGVKAAGTLASSMGTAIDLTLIRYEMMEGILPSSFVKLEVDAHPTEFKEDDEVFTGQWEKAMLTAQSKGWSADKALFNILLGMLGDRVKDGMLKKYNLEIHEGIEAVGDFATSLWDGILTNELYGEDVDRNGIFEVPPCDFGPTDISDKEWSEVKIIQEEQAPVYLIDRHNFRVRDPIETGDAILEVAPRGDRFGRRVLGPDLTFFSSDTEIKVRAIEVEISPKIHAVEPGDVAVFKATVTNANDKGVAWEISPPGAHDFHIDTEADGTSVLTIYTSKDEDDFPVHIKAISTASKGMRALPNAPQREDVALLRNVKLSEIEITPDTCCVELGESETFTAVIHHEDNQQVTWEASAGSITSNGVFTAPSESGSVTITATSVANPNDSAQVSITVGDCECWAATTFSSGGKYEDLLMVQLYLDNKSKEPRIKRLVFAYEGKNEQFLYLEFKDNEGPVLGKAELYHAKMNGDFPKEGKQFLATDQEMSGLPDFAKNVTVNITEFYESDQGLFYLSGNINATVNAMRIGNLYWDESVHESVQIQFQLSSEDPLGERSWFCQNVY